MKDDAYDKKEKRENAKSPSLVRGRRRGRGSN
jgi:hypothetical protein